MMGWVRRWWARKQFDLALADYAYWMREERFLYEALGEPSEQWRAALIEEKRAERRMDAWAKMAWPDG